MVSIRLMRMGDKKRPSYRVVVADSRRYRNGKFIEKIGTYNPLPKNAQINLDMARVDYWIQKGAQPSDTVRSLIERARKTAAAGTTETVPEKLPETVAPTTTEATTDTTTPSVS